VRPVRPVSNLMPEHVGQIHQPNLLRYLLWVVRQHHCTKEQAPAPNVVTGLVKSNIGYRKDQNE
jgi:hypothetical protein